MPINQLRSCCKLSFVQKLNKRITCITKTTTLLVLYLKICIQTNLPFLKELFVHVVKCTFAWQYQAGQRVIL